MSKLKIRETFSYQRPYKSTPEIVDGFRNHFFVTNCEGSNRVLLESGINPIAEIKSNEGKRRPAIPYKK